MPYVTCDKCRYYYNNGKSDLCRNKPLIKAKQLETTPYCDFVNARRNCEGFRLKFGIRFRRWLGLEEKV